MKWSKILINSVPTGVDSDRQVSTPERCHQLRTSTLGKQEMLATRQLYIFGMSAEIRKWKQSAPSFMDIELCYVHATD